MRGSPGEGEWIVMRFWRMVVGMVFGVLLGIVVTSQLIGIPQLKGAFSQDFVPNRVAHTGSYIVDNWILDGIQDWDTAFWTIVLGPIAGGAVGLWLDTRAARKWKGLGRPEDRRAGSPSEHTGRRSRQWTRFKRPRGQQRLKR